MLFLFFANFKNWKGKGIKKMKMGAEIKAIFFDLDGTLLPMDQAYFLKQYFKRITVFAAQNGISPDNFSNGMLAGIEAMIKNDGSCNNEEAFWSAFAAFVDMKQEEVEAILSHFYSSEFKMLRKYTEQNLLAAEVIKAAHFNGKKVVLATNPVFPYFVQKERMSWIGLSEEDFDFITSYENSTYCKPNPEYYLEICKKIGVLPENCLMIGNDESDDMKGASAAGFECFLVTDNRIISENFVWTGERGSFEQALKMIERI